MSFIRMSSRYPFQGQTETADLFGYSTKGIPGIEIVGLGKYNRQTKEKFVYLLKERNIKLPLLRYVLCIEAEFEKKKFSNEEYRFLELPLFLMLLKLSDLIPIYDLTDCLASAKIHINGEIEPFYMDLIEQNRIYEEFSNSYIGSPKLIAPKNFQVLNDFFHISLEDLLGEKFNCISSTRIQKTS
jgi:hypothetical protein